MDQASMARAPRTVRWMNTTYTIGVDSAESGGVVGLFESVVPAGSGPPVHVHHAEDEVIHVLDGEYEFWIEGRTRRVGPGTSVFLARGVPHTFRVVGSRPGRNLTVLTPGGLETFFVEVAEANLELPADTARLAAIAARYRLEFRGPAPWPV